MIFGSGYFGPIDKYAPHNDGSIADAYFDPVTGNLGQPNIEGTQSAASVIGIKDLGASVTEGSRFGSLIQTAGQAIREGAGSIELATIQGGGEPGGAEGYGHEARQALREMARANSISYTSVHTPANTVGNLSGYNYQERGFSDEFRKRSIEEVKKAITFAADVNAGAVVVHTGEALRDMTVAKWNKNMASGKKEFMSFEEEPGRQVIYMVDDRTGKLVTEVRKSNVVFEPQFKRKYNPETGFEEYIDKDGKFLDEKNEDDLFQRIPIWNSEKTRFDTERRDWNYFVKLADRWNKKYKRKNQEGREMEWTPEELFFRKQMESQMLQARGSSLYHGREYDKLDSDRKKLIDTLTYYQKLEKELPEEELWKIMDEDPKLQSHWGRAAHKYVGMKRKRPTEIIKEALNDVELQMKYTHEASSAADANADQYSETIRHVVPVLRYAKDKTTWSYAQAGLLALDQTKNNPHAKKDVFVAPENIFPEMGYGSHPEELIELVQNARQKMVEFLTSKEILNPHELRDEKTGELKIIKNPYYKSDIGKKQAEEYAKRHIKATLDTQHLGMWWSYFTPLPGESEAGRRKRFDTWYKEQVQKMEKADIIGHIHAVDAMGGGHHHLPIGQGILPVKWTLEYLKKKGYKGTMISEGWEENRVTPGRQLTASWRHLGTNIGAGLPMGGGGAPWRDIQYGYFSQMQSPYFIFGAYAPSNDWQLWSQVPME